MAPTSKRVTLTLTSKQAQYLLLVVQDYIDVTKDPAIRRWAKQMMVKLRAVARAAE
jgi:hypothetical protein